MLARHTNENKQFWPKYKVMTITKMWKYSILLKNLQIRVFSLIYRYKRKQLKEYIPSPCAHALLRPILKNIRVGVPLWLQMLQATGALKYNKNNISGH